MVQAGHANLTRKRSTRKVVSAQLQHINRQIGGTSYGNMSLLQVAHAALKL